MPKASKECKKAKIKADSENAIKLEEPVSIYVRGVLILLTSYLAEKGWRHREVALNFLYNENQTTTEQAMVSIFVYIIMMGTMFFGGMFLSKIMVLLDRLLKKMK